MKQAPDYKYELEVDLCTAFIDHLPEGWTPYPETAGFDILLVRKEDGFQIGVEAKLRLNAEVILQALEPSSHYHATTCNPDCRAVLVPASARTTLEGIATRLGITVIKMGCKKKFSRWEQPFRPELPSLQRDTYRDEWFERCPLHRCTLPDYVPDVVAGDKSPVTLTHWKIKAIKLVITLEKIGHVTRGDFKYFGISMSRWTDPYSGWLNKDGKGVWVKGEYLPDFRAQHPKNFAEIEADYEEWKTPPEEQQPGLFVGKGDAA